MRPDGENVIPSAKHLLPPMKTKSSVNPLVGPAWGALRSGQPGGGHSLGDGARVHGHLNLLRSVPLEPSFTITPSQDGFTELTCTLQTVESGFEPQPGRSDAAATGVPGWRGRVTYYPTTCNRDYRGGRRGRAVVTSRLEGSGKSRPSRSCAGSTRWVHSSVRFAPVQRGTAESRHRNRSCLRSTSDRPPTRSTLPPVTTCSRIWDDGRRELAPRACEALHHTSP